MKPACAACSKGADLLLSDKTGKPRVRLEEDKNGADLYLFTKNHKSPTIMLYAAEMLQPDMTDLPSGISPDHVMYGSGFEVFDENSKATGQTEYQQGRGRPHPGRWELEPGYPVWCQRRRPGPLLGTAPWDSKARLRLK